MMNRQLTTRLVAIVILLLLLAGCTSTLQDLEGVQAQEPHAVRVYQNADMFPNVEYFCATAQGPTWLITTRDRVPPVKVAETCVVEEGS